MLNELVILELKAQEANQSRFFFFWGGNCLCFLEEKNWENFGELKI
jgi:hypothetical protein